MSKQKWEVKSHSTGPDISGEYDGYWEIVNEKGAALRTTDDYEDVESDLNCIANMLNDLDLSVETALEINLHCETQLQKMEIETLKAENSKMRQAMGKIEGMARRFGDSGTDPEKDIEVIEKLATEALKTT